MKKWLAGTAAATVVAGTFVAAGLGSSPAQADPPPAPTVSAGTESTYLAGEDLELNITIESAGATAGDQFNLSVGVLLPADVTVFDTGSLGRADTYEAGDVIAGDYTPAQCDAVGLNASTVSGSCVVPAGMQYLVFLNVSDLPEGATTGHALTLRPNADTFEVDAAGLDFEIAAFTSVDATLLPSFPGSTTLATTGAHTSLAGTYELEQPINALRIVKAEPSPESELLRGVHAHTTEYTLSVYHTGEGDITGATVIDFLPAGLEYLGLGGTENTTNANGTQGGSLEYPNAPELSDTPAVATTWAGQTAGETVETVIPTQAEVDAYGLEAGAVYTKVMWELGTLLATNDDRDTTQGRDQVYPGTTELPGRPGVIEIKYRAGIPLFENTLDFGYAADTSGQQIANLDNNRGASTRHGDSDLTAAGPDRPEDNEDGTAANVYENVAVAQGTYGGVAQEDFTSEEVHAVDVRVQKSVTPSSFEQNEFVRYSLNVATSEYVTASSGTGNHPYRVLDTLGDGLCPAFPNGTPVVDGASEPTLTLGDPRDGAVLTPETVSAWNLALAEARVHADCQWGPANFEVDLDEYPYLDVLSGASLQAISFDAATGKFFVYYEIEDMGASSTTPIAYSARQNEAYLGDNGAHGATSSGDVLSNDIRLLMLTETIDDIKTVGTPGMTEEVLTRLNDPWNAWDDSTAEVRAEHSNLDKWVLPRAEGVPTAAQIMNEPYAMSEEAQDGWVKVANEPFAIGDQVWYRVDITPPSGADVRNPKFTDFLPAGVSFDSTDLANNLVVHSPDPQHLGTCEPANEAEWLAEFVSAPIIGGNMITWELGSDQCITGNTNDRFLPLNNPLEVYIKVTVTDVSAFGTVDLTENLAKYQQENVDGEIFFLRDAATQPIAQQIQLLKGVRDINGDAALTAVSQDDADGTVFSSNRDGIEVVQGDEVTYRLDIVGPQVQTTDYVVWDLLPAGITAADVATGSATLRTVTGVDHTESAPVTTGWSVNVYDAGDSEYPTHLRSGADTAGRSIIVFNLHDVTVPASTMATADEEAIEQGVTLGYTVTIPDGTVTDGGDAAQLEQQYDNDSSIVSYGSVSNDAGEVVTVVPVGPNTLSTELPDTDAGEFEIEDTGTFDPSNVYLPGTEVAKELVSTEIPSTSPSVTDPQNTDNVIVQGELATFEYSITIPANTAVRNAKLVDNGVLTWTGNPNVNGRSLAYNFLEDSAEFVVYDEAGDEITGFPWTGFDRIGNATADERAGTLLFPEEYVNRTGEDQTFAVQITVWIDDRDASDAGFNPDLPNNKGLTNTATFTYDDPNSDDPDNPDTITETDTSTVTYREPNLQITKSHDQTGPVSSADTIEYTLSVTNAGYVKSYDNTVVDTVPAGIFVDTDALVTAGTTFTPNAAALEDGLGGTITWSHTAFSELKEIPDTVELTYTATIDPISGAGQQYVNEAVVTGYTLPDTLGDNPSGRRGDRTDDTDATITAVTADIAKGVRIADPTGAEAYTDTVSAPIGETVQYEVDVTLNANINYYSIEITDTLPESLSIVAGTEEIRMTTGTDPPTVTDVTADWTPTTVGQTTTWAYNAHDDGHLLSATDERVITITYDVLLSDAAVPQTTNSLTNTAGVTWAETPTGDPRDPLEDTSTVTVQNPQLNIVKDVKFTEEADTAYRQTAQGGPDRDLTYRVTVSNTGNTAAHEITVTDTVPAGVIVDETSLPTSAELTGANADTGGGTITWQLTGPLEVGAGNAIVLTYNAHFAASGELGETGTVTGQGERLDNTARVTSFESFSRDPSEPTEPTGRTYTPTDVQDTAEARPLFPFIELTKLAGDTSRNAYVGESFEWVLTATNTGLGDAQTVVMTDTLPENWVFDGMVSITVAGVETAPGANPVDTTGSELVWSFGVPAASDTPAPAPVLAPGQSIEIRFTAIPTDPDAITTPGVGDANPHVNWLSAVTTDTTDQTENADNPFTEEPVFDRAFLREANLLLVKETTGGISTVQTNESSPLVDLPLGTWVPGQNPVPDVYNTPGWLVTITNQGPNTSFGPFEIVDTQTLPDGVSLADEWTAWYYASASDVVGAELTISGSGSVDDPFVVGTLTTSLAADGSDRIELRAPLEIESHALAAGDELRNIADVVGRTYETPDNIDEDNEDSVNKPLTAVADLAVSKVVTDPASPAVPVVGSLITWQITVSNNGPSDSVSSTENPITITDVIPAGVSNVSASSNADWVPTVSRAGVDITFVEAGPGDLVTWTYQGEAIARGGTTPVSLTATILTSHTGDLSNTAVVNPGETEDPVDPNNESPVTVTPNDTTRMDITKTRVVPGEDGVWNQVTPEDAPFTPGDPIHYLMTVTNLGPADARNVQVVDEVPDGLSYDTHVGVVGTWEYDPTAGGTTSEGSSADWDTFTLTGAQEAGTANATSFVVTYATEATLEGALVNWAEVTIDNWDEEDPTGPFDRDNHSTDHERIVDLGIVKTHTGTGELTPGTATEFTLTVTNHGPSATEGVIEIVDALPTGLSYVGGTASITVPTGLTAPLDQEPTLSGEDRVLTWNVLTDTDSFVPGNTIVVTFDVMLDPTLREGASLTNRATVTGPEEEPADDPNPNEDPETIEAGPTSATMTLTKVVEDGPWIAGTNVEYTLTMTNAGPSAVPASVTDVLPDGLTLVSMSGDNWDCSDVTVGAGSGTCDYLDTSITDEVVAELHPIGTSTITVVAYIDPSVPVDTELDNIATLTWWDGEGQHEDEKNAEITVSTNGDLGIVKSVITEAGGDVVAEPALVTAGETVWYRLQVTNYGTSDAVGPVTVTDELPLGITVPASLTSAGEWTVVPGSIEPGMPQTVTFTLPGGQVAATAADPERGIAPVIEFEANIDPSVPHEELLTNVADVTSPTEDSNPLNNEDEAEVEARRVIDLAITKTHNADDAGQVYIDEPLDFVLNVVNTGPSVASGVTIVDTIPAGLEVTSVVGPIDGTGWTIDSIVLVDEDDPLAGAIITASYAHDLGVIAPENEANALVISTIPRESALGTDPNHAVVSGNEEDPNLENNEVEDPIDIRPRVTLVVEKTAVGEFKVGETGTFSITVDNFGPHADPGPITVTDVLPEGLVYHSSPELPEGVELDVEGQNVEWIVTEGLEVDERVTLTLVVNVQQAAYPTVTNIVNIDSSAEKTPESVLSDDEIVEIVEADPLEETGAMTIGYLAIAGALLMLGVAAVTTGAQRRKTLPTRAA